MALTIIAFIVILGFLVLVHELGHFLVARWSKIAVEEFGIGFPPKIFAKKVGQTKYAINSIPLGGYVKIKGEDSENEEEDEDSFGSKPVYQRVAVVCAGVTMNVVAGWLLLVILFMAGAPIERTSDIDAKYIYDPHLLITEVLENSPAQAAGLEIGDRIISADSNQFTDIDPFQEFTDSKQGQESIIVYERAKEQYTANITPEIMQDIDENRHIIGVGLSESGTVRFPVHKAIVAGTTSTIGYIQRIAVAFANIISGLFKGQGAGSVGGPVAIAVTTNDVLDLGFSHVIIFTAVLSFNLAIINILPFPALDGGRLIFLFAEKIRGKKGRREIEAWFHRIGFVLLMLLAIVITYRDIVRFGGRIWKAVIG